MSTQHHHGQHEHPHHRNEGSFRPYDNSDPPPEATPVASSILITVEDDSGAVRHGAPGPREVGIQNTAGSPIRIQAGTVAIVVPDGQLGTVMPTGADVTASVTATLAWTVWEPNPAGPGREHPVHYKKDVRVQGPRTLGAGDAVPIGAVRAFTITGEGHLGLVD